MIRIKAAERENFNDWCYLYKQYLEFYKTTLTDKQLEKLWHWFLQPEKEIHCHLALLEEKAIGLVHFRQFLRPIKASVGIFMDDLFISPEYRGKQIAQKLIESVEQYAIENNISTIRWITASDNEAAMKLYDKLANKTSWITYDMMVSEE